ncbi:MAG: hypothetical protein WBC74_00305 [Candidatus Omnitrophota bacterium]
MNVATGCLTFLGFILLLAGIASKLMGMSILAPYISSFLGYFVAANACFLMALVVDKFQKD